VSSWYSLTADFDVAVGNKRARRNSTSSPKQPNKKIRDIDDAGHTLGDGADGATSMGLIVNGQQTLDTCPSGELGRVAYKVQSLLPFPNISSALRKSQRGVRFSIITGSSYPTSEQKDDIVNTIYTDTTNSTPPFEIGKSHHITNAIL
jgi:hypothetical protein